MMSNREAAATVAEAIRKFNQDEDALNNFQSYLEHHFHKWLEKWANTPEGLATELIHFATIYED